jgi:hypothetical protein
LILRILLRNIHVLEYRAPEGFAFPNNLREWERTQYRAAKINAAGQTASKNPALAARQG